MLNQVLCKFCSVPVAPKFLADLEKPNLFGFNRRIYPFITVREQPISDFSASDLVPFCEEL